MFIAFTCTKSSKASMMSCVLQKVSGIAGYQTASVGPGAHNQLIKTAWQGGQSNGYSRLEGKEGASGDF
jgi:hypothetical protein